jgi:hypothetical protein
MLYTLRARQFVQLRGYNLPEYRIIYDLKWLHGHANRTYGTLTENTK